MVTAHGFLNVWLPDRLIQIWFMEWWRLPNTLILDRVRAAKTGERISFTAEEIEVLDGVVRSIKADAK
jgi:hypothetical protein